MRAFEFLPQEFDAVTVNVYLPAFVGVPEMSPDSLSESPAGSFPE